MNLQLARIISAIVLFFGTFFCGMAPALVKSYIISWTNATPDVMEEKWIIRQSKLVMSFFMCFGGGILFSTCFIHLLPELRNTFDEYWEKDYSEKNVTRVNHNKRHSHTFPFPEFIMCGGFLFIYTLEEIIYYMIWKYQKVSLPLVTTTVSQHKNSNHEEITPKEESDELIESDKVSYGSVPEANEDQTLEPHTTTISPLTTHDSKIILFNSGLSLRGIIAVIALSFHSLFEGLSVGMQPTEAEIWTLLFAVAVHKFVIAIFIGIETIQAGTAIKVVIPYMTVFSLMSPIGMLSAMITYSSMAVENELVSGSILAVSTGTLIYVTFFEILLKERNSELPGNLQLLGMFVGFIMMTLLDSLSTGSRKGIH